MPQMGPLLWLGIVLSSWFVLMFLFLFSTPPVLKVPPLPPLTFSPLKWQW